jgi:hypothetical protein
MKTEFSENNKGGQPQVVRCQRKHVRRLFHLITQLHPQFFQPATKAKARKDLTKQMKDDGFDAIQLDEKGERLYVWAWHPNPKHVFSKAKALGVRFK